MQGQMHVHAPELDLPLLLLGHFFLHLILGSRAFIDPFLCFGFGCFPFP